MRADERDETRDPKGAQPGHLRTTAGRRDPRMRDARPNSEARRPARA